MAEGWHGPDEREKVLPGVIAAIFAEVLKQDSVTEDSDFFDLGGDSLAATALVMALESLGIALPMAALIDAPTPAGLAALIADGGLLREPALVHLRQGDKRRAIFIAPGAGGSILEMVPFIRRIDTSRQIYGLQPRDGEGALVRFDTVEEAADLFMPMIRAAQPQGPYVLAGYSLGGMVALELAQRLQARGETIENLIILDTLTPIEFFPPSGKLHFWWRRARHHGAHLTRLPWQAIPLYTWRRGRALTKDFRARVSRSAAPSHREPAPVCADGAMTRAAIVFLKYRPRHFAGNVAYIESERAIEGKTHYPDLLWRSLAEQATFFKVPGDHETMLTRHADGLARAFTSALRIAGSA